MASKVRGAQVRITCKCGCGRSRMVREADVKRGWGAYYDKTCKARYQAARGGRPAKEEMHEAALYEATAGWDEGGWL